MAWYGDAERGRIRIRNAEQSINKKIHLAIGSKVRVRLERETNLYGMPICDELVEVLHQYPEARDRFHALPPVKQRNIIL